MAAWVSGSDSALRCADMTARGSAKGALSPSRTRRAVSPSARSRNGTARARTALANSSRRPPKPSYPRRWASLVIVAGATAARRATSRMERNATSSRWSSSQRAAVWSCGGKSSNADNNRSSTDVILMLELNHRVHIFATIVSMSGHRIGTFHLGGEDIAATGSHWSGAQALLISTSARRRRSWRSGADIHGFHFHAHTRGPHG